MGGGARSWPPPNSLQPLLSPKPWRVSPVSLLPSRFGRLEPAPAPVAAAATAGGCGERGARAEAPAARIGTRRSQRRRGGRSKRSPRRFGVVETRLEGSRRAPTRGQRRQGNRPQPTCRGPASIGGDDPEAESSSGEEGWRGHARAGERGFSDPNELSPHHPGAARGRAGDPGPGRSAHAWRTPGGPGGA